MDPVGSNYRKGLGFIAAITEVDLYLSFPVGPIFWKLLRNISTMYLSRAFYAARHWVCLTKLQNTLKKKFFELGGKCLPFLSKKTKQGKLYPFVCT